MKKIYSYGLKSVVVLALILISGAGFAQSELVFASPTTSGNGSVGTVYKFANVATGIDALVRISGRSSSLVTLNNIDLTSSGFGNAFQPQVSYNGGSVPRNTSWYMEFVITFVRSTDNTVPVIINSFNLTALDMDGDDSRLREEMTFYGQNSYTLENPTSIAVTNVIGGKTFTGSTTDYTNINTSATNVMVTNNYVNTSVFTMRIGGTNGNSSSNGGTRMSSLWFRSFTYNNPNVILPVDLEYFTVKKDNSATILEWASSRETDFGFFTLQRSIDGVTFTDIANVNSNGINSSVIKRYDYTDNNKLSGVVYYRLKMVDKDGSAKYSYVRNVRNGDDKQASVVTFPNPAISELKVSIPSEWQNKQVTYSIYNGNGNIVANKTIPRASQTEVMNVTALKSGNYFIKVVSGNASTVKQFCKTI